VTIGTVSIVTVYAVVFTYYVEEVEAVLNRVEPPTTAPNPSDITENSLKKSK